jgi:hypothetical protein
MPGTKEENQYENLFITKISVSPNTIYGSFRKFWNRNRILNPSALRSLLALFCSKYGPSVTTHFCQHFYSCFKHI